MAYTKEMTTSEILLRLASMRNELLQAVNDIEKISENICYKAEQTEPSAQEYEKWLFKEPSRAEQTEPQYDAEEVAKDINRRVDMVKKEWNARHIEDEPQTERSSKK